MNRKIRVPEREMPKSGGGNFLIATLLYLCVFLFLRMEYYLGWLRIPNNALIVLGLAFVVVAILYFFRKITESVIHRGMSSLGNAFVLFLFGVISTMLNFDKQTNIFEALLGQSFWFACFALFYVFSLEHPDDYIDLVDNILFVVLILFSVRYLIWYFSGIEAEEGTVNCVYYSLLLMPCVFIKKNKLRMAIGISLCVITAVLSAKRTAFLMIVAAIAIILIVETLSRKSIKLFFLTVTLALAVVAVSEVIFNSVDLLLVDRLGSIGEDEGSGRLSIYARVLENFFSQPFIEQLFGFGQNGVYLNQASGTSAHNDFIEVLYDFGYIGLIAYTVFFVRVVSMAVKLYKIKSQYASVYLCTTVFFTFMSITSHLILYPTYFAFLIIFFAIGNAKYYSFKRENA